MRIAVLIVTLASSLTAFADPPADFRDLCAKRAADGDTMAIAGSNGWLFLRSELRHIGVGPFWGEAAAKVSRASKPELADPLPAIVDFHEHLQKRGIELLVRAREQSPETMRIALTSNPNAYTATAAVNRANVFRFLEIGRAHV